MRKTFLKTSILFISVLVLSISGCSENPVKTPTETLLYEYQGILENVGGDCSAVQIRTRSLGTMDLSDADKIKLNFEGMSDADLSSISFYYIENNEQINLVNLPDRDQINNTRSIEVDSPGISTELFSRVTLKSSVCTGQIFFLTLSNLKIYKVNN